jgi:hypothetical protein
MGGFAVGRTLKGQKLSLPTVEVDLITSRTTRSWKLKLKSARKARRGWESFYALVTNSQFFKTKTQPDITLLQARLI